MAERLGLAEGRDFERTTLGSLSMYDRWPRDKALPPLDTAAGIQARLVREGYDPGPVTGDWNERTRKALYRFQWESNHPNPGELDDLTRGWLDQD
ncbi:MAG TPA: peptidoglycan-binding domain-containing protein [Myxococcaceae bacterium]